jgi:hypothetical protein
MDLIAVLTRVVSDGLYLGSLAHDPLTSRASSRAPSGTEHGGRPETPVRQVGPISQAISHHDDRRRRGPEDRDAKKDDQGDIDEVIEGLGDRFAGRDAWSDRTEQ